MRITEWLFFAMMLCFSWFMGVQYERSNMRGCVEQPRPLLKMPTTKAETRRMARYLEARGQ